MKWNRNIIVSIGLFMLVSCGGKLIRTYKSDGNWNNQITPQVSDTSGVFSIEFDNDKKNIVIKATYTSSYKAANELKYLDVKLESDGTELQASKELYTADDGDYKLVVGYRNQLNLKKEGSWNNLGTELHIDTVVNPYLNFSVKIEKKFSVGGKFPKEIKLLLYTETIFGKKDTGVVMFYDEYKDTRAPFRFH